MITVATLIKMLEPCPPDAEIRLLIHGYDAMPIMQVRAFDDNGKPGEPIYLCGPIKGAAHD